MQAPTPLDPPSPPPPKNGFVALVGAGPGHAELLTLRGLHWLRRCDVVLYDGLCNPEMLALAPQAEKICVGKHGQSRIWRQSEIIDETLTHARRGRCVVRLKGGDPAVFARTSEEVDALVDANVPFEIVPGITAALAAGSYAGIPITHRGIASAVALVTGHEEPGKPQSDLDWNALAAFPGTLVIYMGVTTAESWTRALLDAGKSPDTPCAILRRCSLPDQQQIRCRLDQVTGYLTPASKFRPPVITIVGEVTALSPRMDWFSRRALSGQRILVTRPADQMDELAGPLESLGAQVVRQSMIEISPPADWSPVDRSIDRISDYGLIVFASGNGVRFWMDRFFENRHDARSLGHLKIAVVGKATGRALQPYRLRPDLIPDDFSAESLVRELEQGDLLPRLSEQRRKVLIVRASRGGDVLPSGLKHAGASVDEVIAYQHRDVDQVADEVASRVAAGEIDWVTVTSSATAENLHRVFGEALRPCRFAAISPITAETLTRLGYRVEAVAKPYTMAGLVDAIVQSHQFNHAF